MGNTPICTSFATAYCPVHNPPPSETLKLRHLPPTAMAKVQEWTDTSFGRKTALGLTRPMIATDAAQTRQCQCKALGLCIIPLRLQIRKQSWARLPKPLWGDKALAVPWVCSELWDAIKWPSRCTGGMAHTEYAGIGALICWRRSPGQNSDGAPTSSVPDRSEHQQGCCRKRDSSFVQSGNGLGGKQLSCSESGHRLGLERWRRCRQARQEEQDAGRGLTLHMIHNL